jgi:hypothetical protein
MQTHSGQTYGENRYTQEQRDDALFDLLEKFGDLCGTVSVMSKQLDYLWETASHKIEGFGDRDKDVLNEDTTKSSVGEEPPLHTIPHHSARHNSRTHAQDYHQAFMHWEPPHVSLHAHHDSRGDDITKRVRVEVSEFDGKLEPCVLSRIG